MDQAEEPTAYTKWLESSEPMPADQPFIEKIAEKVEEQSEKTQPPLGDE